MVSVNLQLQMSAAVSGVDSAYIGVQARGVLWPAPPPRLPALWPIGPPTIIGKVCPTDIGSLPSLLQWKIRVKGTFLDTCGTWPEMCEAFHSLWSKTLVESVTQPRVSRSFPIFRVVATSWMFPE
jgi:hypothetical protein